MSAPILHLRLPTFTPKPPRPTNYQQQPKNTTNHSDQNHRLVLLPLPGTTGDEIQREQALGGSHISGSEVVGKSPRVNRRERRAIRDVPDGGAGQVGSLQTGHAGGAGSAGRAIVEGLVTVADDGADHGTGHDGLELSSGRDVHTALGDPAGVEPAGGANIEIGYIVLEQVLVGGPAGLGGVERRSKVAR